MTIHEGCVLSGLGMARMKVLVIEQQYGRLRRETEHDVGVLDDLTLVHDPEMGFARSGLVNSMAVEFRVPFVAGTLGGKQAKFVGGAPEAARRVVVRAATPAQMGGARMSQIRGNGCCGSIGMVGRISALGRRS